MCFVRGVSPDRKSVVRSSVEVSVPAERGRVGWGWSSLCSSSRSCSSVSEGAGGAEGLAVDAVAERTNEGVFVVFVVVLFGGIFVEALVVFVHFDASACASRCPGSVGALAGTVDLLPARASIASLLSPGGAVAAGFVGLGRDTFDGRPRLGIASLLVRFGDLTCVCTAEALAWLVFATQQIASSALGHPKLLAARSFGSAVLVSVVLALARLQLAEERLVLYLVNLDLLRPVGEVQAAEARVCASSCSLCTALCVASY
ncbi:hypothetical protein KC330_g193 [Hortaea werneckii]|nr:hypothetical protein KC330_g193 [Hortaea werneckii]